MTLVETPSGADTADRRLGGRFRLDERISLDDQVGGSSGRCDSSWEARGLSLWKATDQLLGRPVTVYLLPPGVPVPRAVVEAVHSAVKVTDPRLATIYDTDFSPDGPYIVAEWSPGTRLEDLVLSGLPHPALAAAMIADAAHAALAPRQRPEDHRTGPGRRPGCGTVRRGGAGPSGRRHHRLGPDAVRPAHRVLARRRGDRTAARSPAQGARVHAAPGPRRGARHPGRHHPPCPARAGRRRPAAGADAGRAGHGASHGAAAVLPAGTAGRRGRGGHGEAACRAAAPAARAGQDRAPHHVVASGVITRRGRVL